MSRITSQIPLFLRLPRSTAWGLIAAILLIALALLAPVQIPVALYKITLISLAAVIGYWIDRAIAPYSRPDSYLHRDWRFGTDEPLGGVDYPVVDGYKMIFASAMLRRAVIVAAVVLGVALGL